MTTDLKFGIQTNDIKHAHSNAIPDTETRSTVVRDAGIFDYVDKTLSPDQINDFFKACDKYGMLARAVGSRHLEAAKASLLTPTEIFSRSNYTFSNNLLTAFTKAAPTPGPRPRPTPLA